MNLSKKTNRHRGHLRRGVATTEFAVCLPIVMLMILAMIESCSMIFLKQSLTIASYEGVRTALVENATGDDVRFSCQQLLDDRRIQGGTISIQPPNFELLAPGEYIQVSVTAPADLNSVIPGSFFSGRTLTGTVTMMKEF
jgi:hypothetical protein